MKQLASLPDEDNYLCKSGRKLTFRYEKTRTSSNGYRSKSKVYVCDSCRNCPHRPTVIQRFYSSIKERFFIQK